MHLTVLSALRRYPLVATVVVAGAVAGGLQLAGWDLAFQATLTTLGAAIVIREVVRMIRDLRSGRWGLDVLAISAIAATLALGEHWASFVVTLMVVGGEALEETASARAQRQISALLDRAPRTAHRIDHEGHPAEVGVDEVRPGDLLQVKVGEMVPVDGTLLASGAEFDESSITGESLPVWREAGAAIASGAVTGSTAVMLKATASASNSQYQRIIAMVEDGASVRGRFVRLADRVAIPFTIGAFAIAAVAWIVSGDPIRFAEVLVVATPCPLLVAAPTAIVAGMGRAARAGIVVKSGDTLERLARVRSAAFDKTGTLTLGSPSVDRWEAVSDTDPALLLTLAAAMERSSAHVLAEAIVAAADKLGVAAPQVDDVREVTGQGLQGRWNGRDVRVGKASFVDPGGADASTSLAAGELAVWVGLDGHAVGRIILRDEVRPDAADVVRTLRGLGIDSIAMLTGDAEANARRVAADIGIDEVHAGASPSAKVEAIARLQPRPVLMVGDGVNDAPVLAAADVGIAMGARGSTAASESAEVVLLVDELSRIPAGIVIARRTLVIARQSIIVGIGLSVAVMIVAAFGVIPAIAGALIQEAIDVITILNGLRAGVSGSSASPRPRAHPRRARAYTPEH
ncbi:MAG: heavy metal translocating P-type ATPase [Pseudolysinimonas sp.]